MKLKRQKLASPRIEMLPLIDIVFLLLVFFIFAMLSMAVHHGQKINLPHSSSAALETEQAIKLTIGNQGGLDRISLNDEPVSLEKLSKRLGDIKSQFQKPEVQIFADKDLSYQRLFEVLDRVQQSGLSRISLQAQMAEDSK